MTDKRCSKCRWWRDALVTKPPRSGDCVHSTTISYRFRQLRDGHSAKARYRTDAACSRYEEMNDG